MEWIEIKNPFAKDSFNLSPPSRWSGLKLMRSHPLPSQRYIVSTLAVEWIEIMHKNKTRKRSINVSTLAVEWIEIL